MGGTAMLNFRVDQIEYGRWQLTDGDAVRVIDADLDQDWGKQALITAVRAMMGTTDAVVEQLAAMLTALEGGAMSFGPSVAELRAAAEAVAWEADHPGSPVPVVVCAADIAPQPVAWLWHDRLPRGRITVLAGHAGEGKSFLTTDWAARVSTGRGWPDGAPCERGNVLFVCAEDNAADTIIPRLIAHDADRSKVHILSGVKWRHEDGQEREVVFTLQNISELEGAIRRYRPALLIIDPIGSYLGGKVDGHRDNEVRSVLAPLGKLAEKYGVAAVVVAHRPKANGTRADDLVIGSRAFTALARVVWHLSCDPQNPERRFLLAGKNNLARKGCGLAFTILGEGADAAIMWEDQPVNMSADEGLAAATSLDKEHPGPAPVARNAAAEWLRTLLADGPREAGEVAQEAKAAGFAWRTVQRAADELAVERVKLRFGGGWVWRLSVPAQGANEDAKSSLEPGNLASWHLGKNKAKNDDKTRFPPRRRQVNFP